MLDDVRQSDMEKTAEERSMTKKSHQKFRALKRKFFPKKVIRKIWTVKFFGPPPNSAPGLHP